MANFLGVLRASGAFGRAIRERDRGNLEAAHDGALRALGLVSSVEPLKKTATTAGAIAIMIQATLLLDEVCEKLGRPPPIEMLRKAHSVIEPLPWVDETWRRAIKDRLPDSDGNDQTGF
jgi:hypothetical protein